MIDYRIYAIEFATEVIKVADVFIDKVESGRAHSKKTYAEMLRLKEYGETLIKNCSE